LFWTIPCEVSFYLILPMLALALSKRWSVTLPILALAAAFFSVMTFLAYSHPKLLPFPPRLVDIAHPTQFVEVFLFGMIGAWLAHRGKRTQAWDAFTRRAAETIAAVALVALLFYVCAITCEQFLWFHRTDYTFRSYSWIFALVFTGVIFVTESVPEGWLARFFSNRLLCLMGILGFSWYLLHFPVFQLLNLIRERLAIDIPAQNAFWFLMAWVTCAGVSWISFRLVEMPVMKLGRWLEGKTRPEAVASGNPN
jgi:peptidoglycan/LPS O-acetylase OafA/YrhL